MSQLKRREVAEAVLALIDSGASSQAIAKSLASYLVNERQSSNVMALMREVENLRFQRTGLLEATASSAHVIDEATKKEITDLFKAKKVHLTHKLVPELVGGVRVQALDKQLDLSVEAKLKQLKSLAA